MDENERPEIGADGICEWVLRAVKRGRPALFLDRDGVLVKEVDHLHRPEDVRIHRGAPELVAAANERGVPVVVITNQAGIGRGLYGWEDFFAVQEAIARELAPAAVDAVFACPFHAEGLPPYDVAEHPDRKPAPGMLFRAERLLGVDLPRSWFVGDAATDVQAAVAAGLACAVHLLTGHGERDRPNVLSRERGSTEVIAFEDLREGPTIQRMLDALAT